MCALRQTKRELELETWKIVNESRLDVEIFQDTPGGPISGFRMIVKGPAANIPSVSNNRQMFVPTLQLETTIRQMISSPRNAHYLARKAMGLLDRLRPCIMLNPKHKSRLDALKILYRQEIATPVMREKIRGTVLRLGASKENPWVFYCYLSNESNRSDSHNLPKALCDWMEDVGLLDNDLYIDGGCWRKRYLHDERVDFLELIAVPYNKAREGICQTRDLIMKSLQSSNVSPTVPLK